MKFFNRDKGFGFIVPDSGERDIFVHISAVERGGFQTLDEGQKISFETEADRMGRGPKAVFLREIEDGGDQSGGGDDGSGDAGTDDRQI